MEELELLSAKLKIKELKKLVDELLIAEEVSDLERGHLKGIKSILNRQNEEFSKSRYPSNERG